VGSWPESVAVGDVTGDGRGDVLLATEEYNDPQNDFKLFFFRQSGNGMLDSPIRLDTGGPGGRLGMAVGDLTNDGLEDVALATGGGGINLYRQVDGTIVGPEIIPGTTGGQVEIADMNADGQNDMVSEAGNRGVILARNDGFGFTVLPVTAQWPQEEIGIGDATGDGRLDVVGFTCAWIRVYPQVGDLHFGHPTTYESDNENCGDGIEVGDFSGDGRDDVVMTFGLNQPRPGSIFSFRTLTAPSIHPSCTRRTTTRSQSKRSTWTVTAAPTLSRYTAGTIASDSSFRRRSGRSIQNSSSPFRTQRTTTRLPLRSAISAAMAVQT
jgi:hypothetical protein